ADRGRRAEAGVSAGSQSEICLWPLRLSGYPALAAASKECAATGLSRVGCRLRDDGQQARVGITSASEPRAAMGTRQRPDDNSIGDRGLLPREQTSEYISCRSFQPHERIAM